MKAKIGVFMFTVAAWAGMAFAVNGTGYYNLVQKMNMWGSSSTMSLVLSQSATPCTPRVGNCVASVKDTPANLAQMLNDSWVTSVVMSSWPLELGSDIDLGEFSSETEVGKCDVNHVPLPLMSDTDIDGKGFKVSHLCYAKTVTEDDPMTAPVGLFEKASNVSIKNFKLNGVRIYIDGESGNGADYYPVGGLVGIIQMATIDSVVLANDTIQAPLAGGLVGYVENSTVKHVSGDDDIDVSNKVEITNGYAGSKVVNPVLDYQVFLGGLVGVAYRNENKGDTTFRDDSLKVSVRNYALGNKSALGGVAGLFSTIGELSLNLQIYTKYKENETVPSKISGGSSMGGLFGVRTVYVKYNTPIAGDYALETSHFDGEISKSSSPSVIALGGLIGLDSSIAGMSSSILRSTANVAISDSIEKAALYRYHAGGLLGYGSSCNGSTDAYNDYLSIIDSKSSGSITVAASAKAVEGLHSHTYLGGIAGRGCLAQASDKGLLNDTSSVSITSRVKTGLDDKYVSNGNHAHDSLFVGGMVGYVQASVTKTNELSGLRYTGSIAVEDSINNTFVGGIVGSFLQLEGAKSLHFKDVLVNNESLITYKAVEGSYSSLDKQAAKIGGLCGFCREVAMVELVGVTGKIDVSGSYSGDTLLVGGLLGSTSSTMNDFILKNSFMIGDVSVSATSGYSKVGYFIGLAFWNGAKQSYELRSSYHYGANDLAVGPFGMLSNGSDITSNWKTNDNIHFVIRNGESQNLSPKATHQNGAEVAETMASSAFAGFLNKYYSVAGGYTEADYAWSYKKGENNDFPIFASVKNPPVKPDMSTNTYRVVFVDKDGETIDVQNVNPGEAATEPGEDLIPVFEGYTFTGTWDPATFDNVSSDLTVKAVYKINTYTVIFLDDKNKEIKKYADVEYKSLVLPPENMDNRVGYDFTGWSDSSFNEVKSDLTIKALYTPKMYKITFVDYNDSLLISLLKEYNSKVTAPEDMNRAATKDYEYSFKAWSPAITAVTGDAVYKAVYDSVKIAHPESSSSVTSSSSVVSSSSVESSSSVPESSSSVVESSSSTPVVSSSSITGEIKIVKPVIKTSGSAILLTFGTENIDESAVARIVVIGENDTILTQDISKSVVGGGEWEMTPAPIGKFYVTLTVDDKVRPQAVYQDSFEVASEIKAAPGSWQMVSLSALDKQKIRTDDASFYWWDEKNPVGDYWQYRAFDGESVDATRGFWYGTTIGNPLMIRESTGSKDSEIVWELDSLYSGWNLVANPYGWKVDLSKGAADNGEKVIFWRWNSTAGNYDPATTELGPYEAVWAKVSKSTTWRMSAAPVFDVEERVYADSAKALHKDVAGIKGAWSLKVSLADDYGKLDSWNMIGAGAAETLDEPPAGMGNHVSLSIRNSEKGAKLAKSIKAVADEYNWILDVSASSVRVGKLSFDGIAELNKLGLKLFVEADGKVTELREGETFKVALSKSAKQVNVRVTAGNAVVASSKVSGFGSSLVGGALQLGFMAPETLAGANVSYAVVGVDGKKVAAGSFKATAGSNQFSLKAPKTGVYFAKIKIGSQQLTGKILVK